jgi:hypothetical protein
MGSDNPKGLPLYPRAKIGLLDRQVDVAGSHVAGRSGCQFSLARESRGCRQTKLKGCSALSTTIVLFESLRYYKSFSVFRPSLEL